MAVLVSVAFRLWSAVGVFLSLILSSGSTYLLLIRRKDSHESKTPRRWSLMSLANCFSCGVFMGTCFLGLMPHVRQQEALLRQSLNYTEATGRFSRLPVSELSLLLGFLLVLVSEHVSCWCGGGGGGKREAPSSERGLFAADFEMEPLVLDAPLTRDRADAPAFGATALLLALSLHSVFEGVALGLQAEAGAFGRLLVGVMLHELLCAAAFGVSLARQRTPLGHATAAALALSVTIPLGMSVAALLPTDESVPLICVRVAAEGVAAGTFVYVACVEMLGAEFAHAAHHDHSHHSAITHHSEDALAKVFCIALGVLSFASLLLISGA